MRGMSPDAMRPSTREARAGACGAASTPAVLRPRAAIAAGLPRAEAQYLLQALLGVGIQSGNNAYVQARGRLPLRVLRQMLDRAGSLEGFFVDGRDAVNPDMARDLERFSDRALGFDVTPVYGARRRTGGVRYFFPRPSTGSACKRLNLFLRWMVRRDALDCGIWTRVRPSDLMIPLELFFCRSRHKDNHYFLPVCALMDANIIIRITFNMGQDPKMHHVCDVVVRLA